MCGGDEKKMIMTEGKDRLITDYLSDYEFESDKDLQQWEAFIKDLETRYPKFRDLVSACIQSMTFDTAIEIARPWNRSLWEKVLMIRRLFSEGNIDAIAEFLAADELTAEYFADEEWASMPGVKKCFKNPEVWEDIENDPEDVIDQLIDKCRNALKESN